MRCAKVPTSSAAPRTRPTAGRGKGTRVAQTRALPTKAARRRAVPGNVAKPTAQVLKLEPGRWVLRLPIRTVSEANNRDGWARRYQRSKGQKQLAYATAFMALHGEPREAFWVVRLTRCAPGNIDGHDNLRSALKATVDGIAMAIGLDDGDPRIAWCYAKRRTARGHYGVEVDVVHCRTMADFAHERDVVQFTVTNAGAGIPSEES